MEELDAGTIAAFCQGRASGRHRPEKAKQLPYVQKISLFNLHDRPRKAIAQGRR